jgi:very-short-patch-repair endonuclease
MRAFACDARVMARCLAASSSELEEQMLELCRVHDLPRPQVNTPVQGLEADFLFRPQRLVVETDGWAYHRTRSGFERDRHRDAILARAGYRVLRFSHRQLQHDAETVAEALAAALDGPRAADAPHKHS